jgi:hypothetical protein
LNGLVASIADTSDKDRASLYASWNRVPVWDGHAVVGHDYAGCTVSYCGKVISINTNATSQKLSNSVRDINNGTWYITVLSNRDSTKYDAWFGTVCPSNCNSQGTCQRDADNYGVCKCNDGFEKLNCVAKDNFLIEYIILIIIAALVLVSALLGLIAWAYMRRRSQYVEVR